MAVNEPIRDRRRQALIKATIAVIAKHGASGTTVERVARKAGVSVGLMNFHFDSKERLFRETFRHLSEEYEDVWQQNLRAVGIDPRSRLERMIESNFDKRIFTREKLAVWFTFWSDAQLRDRYRAAATRVERRYIAAIEKEVAALLARELTQGSERRAALDGDDRRFLAAGPALSARLHARRRRSGLPYVYRRAYRPYAPALAAH